MTDKIKALVERLEVADVCTDSFAAVLNTDLAEAITILKPLAEGTHVVVPAKTVMQLLIAKAFTGYVQGRFPDDIEIQVCRQAADAAVDAMLGASELLPPATGEKDE